jgi:Lar family restriction alleviation protein
MKETMKNCPFCNGDDIEVSSNATDNYSCFCNECGAQGPSGETEEEAKELWNKRA